ncbi:hypothetical protein H8E88_16820 [candidate division KSB1 bacterium]|nr:hypothetical protein [candidate division KSB1 bacterium]
MKVLYKALLISILLSIGYAQTEVSGLINSNTTWDSTGSPYIVIGNIAVMNATLNIGPGVEVRFNQDLNMQILSGGELIAQGSEIDSIVFTANSEGITWNGISFTQDAIPSTIESDTVYISGSCIDYVIISNAQVSSITSEIYLIIINSRFSNNSATSGSGGAISGIGGYRLFIVKSKFENNSSGTGGAIYYAKTIYNSVFKNNNANGGGAVHSALKIVNSTFSGNIAGNGGGLYNVDSVYNCLFFNNGCPIDLGGSGNGGATYNAKFIENSIFLENYGRSGAVYTYGRSLRVRNCLFIDNYSNQSYGEGGAIHYSDSNSGNNRVLSVTNSIFKGNSARTGGAIFYHVSYPGTNRYFSISESTFKDNSATIAGAIYAYSRSSIDGYISNCIFSHNEPGSVKNVHDTPFLIEKNIFEGHNSLAVEGNSYGSFNNFYNNTTFSIKMVSGQSIYDFKNNYWGSKDSSYIADNLIFDFYDDPNFNTNLADFIPFLSIPSDSTHKNPNVILNILLKTDSTFQIDLIDSVYINSNIFVQLDAEDKNSYCSDLTVAYITNLSTQDTIVTTLVESGDSTGIFRAIAKVQNSTDNINDIIGANVGDQIKIVSKTDTTKYYSFIVAQTPPPIVSNLDIGGSDDIFHILNSTPCISWSYSDPLSSPQTNYHIQVGLDTNLSIAEMWDTGEINSADTFAVYSGNTLLNDSTYYIRIRVNNGTRWSSWIDTSFGLNSNPQMALIDVSVTEDDTLLLNLNDFISDSDDPDSLLNVSSDGSDNIIVNINTDDHQASFIPVENWNGSEKIIFTCTDPWEFQTYDSLSLTVLPINDQPYFSQLLPDVLVDEDDFGAVIIPRLEDYFADVDSLDHLSFIGLALDAGLDSLSIGSGGGMAFDQRFGLGRISPELRSQKRAILSVKRSQVKIKQNRLFSGSKLPAQTLNSEIKTSADISSTYSSFSRQTQADTTALIVYPTLNFNGAIRIVVTAIDDSSASVSDTLFLTVMPINDVPVLSAIPDTSILEDDTLRLALSVFDLDDDSLTRSGPQSLDTFSHF